MKKSFFIIPLLFLTFVACERIEHKPNTNLAFTQSNADSNALAVLTPGDQQETEKDHAITQTIRRKIIEDALMSRNANNIKIITIHGVVTLKGPVENAAEKEKIEKIVGQVNTIKRVDNQLEVKR